LKWNAEGLLQLVNSGGDQSPSMILKSLEAMIGLTDSIIDIVKRIASELRPSILDDLGLIAAIESQAEQFQNRTGITSYFDSRLDTVTLNRERSTAVFRIFQETLTNILRHANATRVDVAADEQAGEFVLTVRDNGKGITDEAKLQPLSLGLLGMQERAHLIGGTINIRGTEDQGTTVTLRVPLSRPMPDSQAQAEADQ
jgi:signal transduction histidine kinase